jgi:hypothetical protein
VEEQTTDNPVRVGAALEERDQFSLGLLRPDGTQTHYDKAQQVAIGVLGQAGKDACGPGLAQPPDCSHHLKCFRTLEAIF